MRMRCVPCVPLRAVEHAVFDVAVSQVAFRTEYVRLKEKYGKQWVAKWPEQTDPAK